MNKRTILAAVLLLSAMIFAAVRVLSPAFNFTASRDSALEPYLVGQMAYLTVAEEPWPLSDHVIALGDGTPVTLSDMAGKAMLINFWASWCLPCRIEMDELSSLQSQVVGDDFEVVAINVDRGGHLMAAEVLEEWGIEGLAIYADPTMRVAFDNAAPGLPTSLIVDRNGMIRAYYLGPLQWDNAEAIELFKALRDGKI